jgi:AcrR family transcriptional regulator
VNAVARPGRPRSAACDQAIVGAALEVFAEEGFDGLTMEAVAARAGVGKATLYRRYPGKAALVLEAVSCLAASDAPPPDTGSFTGDLTAHARQLVHMLTATEAGRFLPQLVAALPRARELASAFERFVAARRANLRAVVERAVARGDVGPEVDPGLVADLVAGSIFYRHLVSRAPLDEAYADGVVAMVTTATERSSTAAPEPVGAGR